MFWLWTLIAFAWIFVLLLSLRNRKQTSPSQSATRKYHYDKTIPKIIYTFWDSPVTLPPIVEKSISTWKKHCPDYEIRILDYENTKHMGIRHKDSHARYSDFVRLYVLEKTGGIWIDASVFLNKPVDDWLTHEHDYTGYNAMYHETDYRFPVVESWFMAAPKGSPFIRDWKNEFFRANDFDTIGDYVDDLLKKGVDDQKIGLIDNGHYLAVYLAAQYCQQNIGKYDLNLMSSDDDAYKHVMSTPLKWFGNEQAVNELCDNIKQYKKTTKMIKLTSEHRKYIDEDCISKL